MQGHWWINQTNFKLLPMKIKKLSTNYTITTKHWGKITGLWFRMLWTYHPNKPARTNIYPPKPL